jgi:hypothetical protein
MLLISDQSIQYKVYISHLGSPANPISGNYWIFFFFSAMRNFSWLSRLQMPGLDRARLATIALGESQNII